MCTCLCAHSFVSVNELVRIYVFMCVCVSAHVCMRVYAYLHVNGHVCMHMYTCARDSTAWDVSILH